MLHCPTRAHVVFSETSSELIKFCSQTCWTDNKCSTDLFEKNSKKQVWQGDKVTQNCEINKERFEHAQMDLKNWLFFFRLEIQIIVIYFLEWQLFYTYSNCIGILALWNAAPLCKSSNFTHFTKKHKFSLTFSFQSQYCNLYTHGGGGVICRNPVQRGLPQKWAWSVMQGMHCVERWPGNAVDLSVLHQLIFPTQNSPMPPSTFQENPGIVHFLFVVVFSLKQH